MTPHPNLAEAPAIPFCEVLAHIRARQTGALKLFVAMLAASLLLAALVPPRFAATATLAILPAPEFTVRQDAGSHAFSTSALAMDQIMKAEAEILQSADLHEATLHEIGMENLYPQLRPNDAGLVRRTLHLMLHALLSPWIAAAPDTKATRLERALQWFASDLLILPAKDANVIEVTFRHRDGAIAAQTINVMLSDYARRRGRLYDDPQLEIVRRETERLGVTVRNADAALAEFMASHGIADYAAERDLLVRRQSAIRQAQADSVVAAGEQQAKLTSLDRLIRAMPPTVSLFAENDTDARLQSIDASLADLHAQLAAARAHYRDTSRKVTDLMSQLRARESDRRTAAHATAPSATRSGRSPALDAMLLDRAHAATDYAAAIARGIGLREESIELAARLAGLIGEATSLADLQRRKNAAETAFANASQVLAERHMTESEDALRLANVRIIQSARPPLHATRTPLLTALAGMLFACLAALIWSVAGLLLHPTLRTEEGLAQATGLPVLGRFPAGTRGSDVYVPG